VAGELDVVQRRESPIAESPARAPDCGRQYRRRSHGRGCHVSAREDVEVGESAAQAVIREVAEELGVTIALTGLSDVYSDPTHVLLDPDGTVHQQLALCFHAVPAPAHATEAPRPDGIETLEAAWGAPACSRPGYGQRNMPRARTTP
jgi:hypothetical protein